MVGNADRDALATGQQHGGQVERSRHNQRQCAGPVAAGEVGGKGRDSLGRHRKIFIFRQEHGDSLRARTLLDLVEPFDGGGFESRHPDTIDRISRKDHRLPRMQLIKRGGYCLRCVDRNGGRGMRTFHKDWPGLP